MSLLDILCGALGAFCFMMLVALPYYVVGRVDRAESQKRTEELLKNAENFRERLSDPAQAEELRKLIDELEAQIKQLQGQLNQYAYENDQLKEESARLTSENMGLRSRIAQLEQEKAQLVTENAQLQETNAALTEENVAVKQQLAAKKPFVVMATSNSQAIDLYLERTRFIVLGNKFETFDPAAPGHMSPIPDDVIGWALMNGVTFWVNANSKPGDAYRIYVKYLKLYDQIANGDTTVKLNFFGAIEDQNAGATVALNTARPYALVGIVSVEPDGKLSFKEASAAERDDDWRKRMKSDPPPAPTPAPRVAPSASPSATGTPSAEERDERIREYIRRRSGGSPAPTTAPSSTASALSPEEMDRIRKRAAEERARIEEMRRQGSASPAPTP